MDLLLVIGIALLANALDLSGRTETPPLLHEANLIGRVLRNVFLFLVIASMIVNKRGEGMLIDIVLGVVGAVVGGWIFNAIGHSDVTGLNMYSILVSVVGAVIVLLVYHAIRGMTSHPGSI